MRFLNPRKSWFIRITKEKGVLLWFSPAPESTRRTLSFLWTSERVSILAGVLSRVLIGGGNILDRTFLNRLQVPTIHWNTGWRRWFPHPYPGTSRVQGSQQVVSLLTLVDHHFSEPGSVEPGFTVGNILRGAAEHWFTFRNWFNPLPPGSTQHTISIWYLIPWYLKHSIITVNMMNKYSYIFQHEEIEISVLVKNSNFLIFISLQRNGVNFLYLKNLQHLVAKVTGFKNLSL